MTVLRNAIRNCDSCGNPYAAKSVRSRFCSDTCRVRHSRGAVSAPSAESSESPLVKATREELEAAGKVDTVLGQTALILAAAMTTAQTTAGVTALSKELSRVAAAAIGSAPTPGGAGDYIDEIKKRRDAKRRAQP
jgi:hypothetical protein